MKQITLTGCFLNSVPDTQRSNFWEDLEYLTNYYDWTVKVHGLHWDKQV